MKIFKKVVQLDSERRFLLEKIIELTTDLDKCLWKQIQSSLSIRKCISEEIDRGEKNCQCDNINEPTKLFCKSCHDKNNKEPEIQLNTINDLLKQNKKALKITKGLMSKYVDFQKIVKRQKKLLKKCYF